MQISDNAAIVTGGASGLGGATARALAARGAQVFIRLARQDTELRLSIRDDGPGFDPHEVARRAGRSNWGLMSMRERAELIGARFSVASSPGHGTEVTVILPIE